MNESFNIEVELPVVGTEEAEYRFVKIKVKCEYRYENTGIGGYEFWGIKGIDRGTDYAVIENTEWDTTGFTQEEIELINLDIKNNISGWENTILNGRVNFCVYSDED